MKKVLILISLACALAATADAGIYYKSRTWQEGERDNEAMNMTVEAWIEGDSAKIQFTESGNPWMPPGSYLVTTDGGRTLYLVNPQDQTYGEWDLDGILKLAGGILGGMKGIFSMEFENPRVETLLEQPGGAVAGLPTTHYRYRTSYDLKMKVLGMKRSQSIESIQDVWYTTAVSDAGFGVWLRKEPPKTGNEDLDRLIELETAKIKGFPLKTVDESTVTGKKGKEATTRTITEVVELQQGVAMAGGTFQWPPTYTQKQLMPSEEQLAAQQEDAESGDEEEEKKGGLLGRLKRFGKKDDG